MFRSRLKTVLLVTALLALAIPAVPVLADCTETVNPYGGKDWDCTGNTIGVINGTPLSDRITNHGTVTGYIWSAGFSSSSQQQDTITNNGVVGDHQPNPETGDDDDGLWGGAGNDTIINNGTVYGGALGAIFGDGSAAYAPDQDYIVHNGTAHGDINGDFQARGHDTIVINGIVNGGVYGDINPLYIGWGPNSGGNDLVIIRDNAHITGIIDGNMGNDTLRFELTAQSQAEYDLLLATLAAAAPANDSLTFRGRTFNWRNFEIITHQIAWTTTATPTVSPSETPATATNTPSPTNTPSAPVVTIVMPANDGSPVNTVEDTRFRATAYDPAVGTADGAGIQRVAFEIYTPNNVLAFSSSDTTAPYCAFGGNNPCNFTSLQGGGANGTYTLRARAQASGGTWSNWVSRTFVIGAPSATATFTPTATPSNTPVPPTATFTPTNTPVPPTATNTPSATPDNTPEATPTDTPTDTPTNTPTATFTPSITPTNTPTNTATATNTPTNTPTATNTPAGIVVNIIVPANNGSSVTGVQDTRFQAVAYDLNVGSADGSGIQQVAFEIYSPGNVRVYTSSDTAAAYCAFGGNGPCNMTNLQSGAQSGTYILRARALTSSGTWSNWVSRTFVIVLPSGSGAGVAPANALVVGTATTLPSPLPSHTPTIVPTDVPTQPPPVIPTDIPTEAQPVAPAESDSPTEAPSDIPGGTS